MEPEVSLSHPQVPATCPYPEPARSSLYPHTSLPEDPSQYYHPFTPGSSKRSLYLRFPHQTLYTTLFSPYVLHVPPISFFSIWSLANTGWGPQIIKLLIMSFSPLPYYLVPNNTKMEAVKTCLVKKHRPIMYGSAVMGLWIISVIRTRRSTFWIM